MVMFVVDFSTHKDLTGKRAACAAAGLGDHYSTEQGLCQWDSTRGRAGQGRTAT